MNLTFHIIYTPGTVKYLSLLVFSLLKWSDCSFRLVANGCTSGEVRLLQALCHNSNRLELLVLPSKTMIKHGEALSYLQSLNHSEYFCFMDSDILSNGDFLHEFGLYLNRYAGIFSGDSVWCKHEEQVLPESFPKMAGRYNRTSRGECLGSSYFAIYDNRVLTQVIRSTGANFRKYQWQELPNQYQTQLAKMNLKKEKYDTGKILNLLLLSTDAPLIFKNNPSLQHIGCMSSSFTLNNSDFWKPSRNLKELLARIPEEQSRQLMLLQKRKSLTSHYFNQFFQSLFEKQPLPTIPEIADPEIEERITSLTKSIMALYEEFGEQLPF